MSMVMFLWAAGCMRSRAIRVPLRALPCDRSRDRFSCSLSAHVCLHPRIAATLRPTCDHARTACHALPLRLHCVAPPLPLLRGRTGRAALSSVPARRPLALMAQRTHGRVATRWRWRAALQLLHSEHPYTVCRHSKLPRLGHFFKPFRGRICAHSRRCLGFARNTDPCARGYTCCALHQACNALRGRDQVRRFGALRRLAEGRCRRTVGLSGMPLCSGDAFSGRRASLKNSARF